MRWLDQNPKDLSSCVTLEKISIKASVLRPYVVHQLPVPFEYCEPEPSGRLAAPARLLCWLEFIRDPPDDFLAFACRAVPPIPAAQTQRDYQSLPIQLGCFNGRDTYFYHALAQRIPGGRVGIVKLHQGMLWTMFPPSPCLT